MFFLIHTMTITECEYVLQAQFIHSLSRNLARIEDAQLIGRRLSLRLHPNLRQNRQKANLCRLHAPTVKTLMKRNSAHIRHHVRTIHISPSAKPYVLPDENSPKNEIIVPPSPPSPKISNNVVSEVPVAAVDNSKSCSESLLDGSNPEETVRWLTSNRFDKYVTTFSSFSGADMLRMSREDLIQICGQADGIRLYNALHVKAIAPKLTIYVSHEHPKVFNAIFLSSYSSNELIQKLSMLTGINSDKIRNVFVQGPQAIHVLLSNDVVSRIKEESMFNLDVLQENENNYVLLLKPSGK